MRLAENRGRQRSLVAIAVAAAAAACPDDGGSNGFKPDVTCTTAPFLQWAGDASHSNATCNQGQALSRILAEVVVDPFVAQAEAEANGNLLAHYQAPLVQGDELLMSAKWGTYVSCNPPGSGAPAPCGPDAWNAQTWGVQKWAWQGGELKKQWNYESDWKPPPNGSAFGGWEPVYHAAMTAAHVFAPAAGGRVVQLDRKTGAVVHTFAPLGQVLDKNAYVAGPLVVDAAGNVVYNAVRLDAAKPWSTDVTGAWLVRVRPSDNGEEAASFAALVPGAPQGSDCLGTFPAPQQGQPALPPPDVDGQPAKPNAIPCGSQRPGFNVAPAIAADGTIYTVSRAHLASRYAYVVAVKPDLTPKWAASLRDRLNDGCGVLVAKNDNRFACASAARTGVDPFTNEAPAGRVQDSGTSSPVALPDGAVLYGAFTSYNGSRGHLFKFAADGSFAGAYDFGWDTTPAFFRHGQTWSIVLKDNHYAGPGPYQITQLDAALRPEWRFTSTNTQSCKRNPDGTRSCLEDPEDANGFEWCVNAPVVDRDGTVYANSEDGWLYAIGQGGKLKGSLFLDQALGAAYTPLSMDEQGRVYTQNNGKLYVVGK